MKIQFESEALSRRVGPHMFYAVIRFGLATLGVGLSRNLFLSLTCLFIGASNELGEFESGSMAAMIGTVGSVVVGGIGTLIVAALWIRWFPELWRRDKFAED